MGHKNVTIASILKIWLRFDSKSLKLDHDIKINHFGSLSMKLLPLKKVSLVLKIGENWSKIGYQKYINWTPEN